MGWIFHLPKTVKNTSRKLSVPLLPIIKMKIGTAWFPSWVSPDKEVKGQKVSLRSCSGFTVQGVSVTELPSPGCRDSNTVSKRALSLYSTWLYSAVLCFMVCSVLVASAARATLSALRVFLFGFWLKRLDGRRFCSNFVLFGEGSIS